MAWLKWRGSPERGRWYAVWTEKIGDRVRKRYKGLSRDKRQAAALKREIETNLMRRGLGLEQNVPVRQLRDDYLRLLAADGCAASYLARVRIVLGHLERLYPNLKVAQVNADVLDGFKTRRRQEDEAAATTINREVSTIKAAVRKGRRWAYQVNDLSDVGKVKGAKPSKRAFTLEQVRLMLARARAVFRIVVYLGFYAGLRRSEILGLRWRDVDFPGRRLRLGEGWRAKGGNQRAVPMNARLAAVLTAWRAESAAAGEDARVVPWDKRPEYLSARFTYFLRKQCAIPMGTIHTFRHTMITTLKRKDVDTAKTQRLVGHTSEKTTQDYTHMEVEDLRAAVDVLDVDAKDDLNASK